MKKKILSLCLVVALLATAVIGGTLAYFTDKDQNTNEFTVGGIEIDLWETVWHEDGAGNEKTVTSAGAEVTDEENKLGYENKDNPNVKYEDIMPGDKMTKIVTVENKEDYPVYMALTIKQEGYTTYNQNIDDYYENMELEDLQALLGFTTNDLKNQYSTTDACMQYITDSVFTGDDWNGLCYTKDSTSNSLRYYPVNVKNMVANQDGSESYVGSNATEPVLIAVDHAVGNFDWERNYANSAALNMIKYKNDFSEIDYEADPRTGNVGRIWVYCLYMPANTSYTMDISVTCPTFIDANSIAAFEGMVLDVQATAIQVDGFASAKDAFQVLADTYGFGF